MHNIKTPIFTFILIKNKNSKSNRDTLSYILENSKGRMF